MRASIHAASAGLLGIAALHVIWATGSSWPMRDGRLMTDTVAGRPDEPPSASACLAVATALTSAAALVEGHPRSRPQLARLGAAAVVAVLSIRGGLGLAGRTDVIAPGSVSERFRSMDRRIYSPLCLTLAALAVPAVGPRRR